MSYQVLARKWRPATFDQVVGQEHVLKALTHALEQNRLHHAYLFTGTRGVGKTSIARLLAKGLNCEQGITATPCGQCSHCQEISQGRFVDLLEIDAASRTKVDDTREILDNVQYQPVRGRFKVYLIDEVHMLSRHSFNALLKTLEEPPPHVKFLLATTDPQKLPVTVLSRCLQFNLKSVTAGRIAEHLAKVLGADDVPHDVQALQLLAQAADGSVRDSLSLTDQAIAHGGGQVQLASVQAMLGTLDTSFALRLVHALCEGKVPAMMTVLDEVEAFAPDHDELLRQMLALLHQVALCQFNARASALTDQAEAIQALAQSLDREQVQLWYQMLAQGRQDLALAPDARSGLEMVLLRALAFAPVEAAPPMSARQPQMKAAAPVPSAPAVAPVAASEVAKAAETPVAEPIAEPKPEPVKTEVAKPAPVAPRQVEPTQAENAEPVSGQPATEAAAQGEIKAAIPVVEPVEAASAAKPAPQPETTPAPEPTPEAVDPQMAALMAMDQEEAALASEQELILGQAASFTQQPMPTSPRQAAPESAPDSAKASVPASKQPEDKAAGGQLGGIQDLLNQALANRRSLDQLLGQTGEAEKEATPAPKTKAAPEAIKPEARPTPEAAQKLANEPEARSAQRQAAPVAPQAPAETQAAPAKAQADDKPPWDLDEPTGTQPVGEPVGKQVSEAVEPVSQPAAPAPVSAPNPVAMQSAEARVLETAVAVPNKAVEPQQSATPPTMPEAAGERELDLEWYRAIAHLGIGARPRQLAINSVLEREGEVVRLRLIDEQRHLNHPSVIGPLKEKMEALWGQPVSLEIVESNTPGRETPLQIRRRLHQERLDQAKVDLLADPAVQWLQSELGASLIDASVNYQHTD